MAVRPSVEMVPIDIYWNGGRVGQAADCLTGKWRYDDTPPMLSRLIGDCRWHAFQIQPLSA